MTTIVKLYLIECVISSIVSGAITIFMFNRRNSNIMTKILMYTFLCLFLSHICRTLIYFLSPIRLYLFIAQTIEMLGILFYGIFLIGNFMSKKKEI